MTGPRPPAARVAYLDASAIVKLAVAERESQGLRTFLGSFDSLITSRLAHIEVTRAATRRGVDAGRVADVLDRLGLVELTPSIAGMAARLAPARLRSLDAIHIATALELRPALTAFVTYDERQRDAAGRNGLEVAAPA